MTFAVVLLVTALICCVLRNPLRKAPWLFYGLAVVFVVLYLVAGTLGLPGPVNQALLVLMNKCLLPTALFVLVMYVGVFPKGSAIRALAAAPAHPGVHCGLHLGAGPYGALYRAYAARVLGGGAVATNVLVSFAIAVVLFALLAVLGVTSFNAVRSRMGTLAWRRVQRFAYAFYALVYAHVLVMLGPAALNGGASALEGVAVYTAVLWGSMGSSG